MRTQKVTLLVVALSLPLVGGCQTNEQAGGLIGGGGGALACGAAGAAIFHHSALGMLLPAAACGAAGYFIGSAIGRQLDERDRQRAAAAVQQALVEPEPSRRGAHHPRTVHWTSDHSGAHGTATVVAAQPTANGGECKTVREIAYIKGEEVPQTTRYCRTAEGSYAAQT